MKNMALLLLTALLHTATGASAHFTLAVRQATQGAASRLTLRIARGRGTEATLRVRIHIPEGMVSVKPMPKADWKARVTADPCKNMLIGAIATGRQDQVPALRRFPLVRITTSGAGMFS